MNAIKSFLLISGTEQLALPRGVRASPIRNNIRINRPVLHCACGHRDRIRIDTASPRPQTFVGVKRCTSFLFVHHGGQSRSGERTGITSLTNSTDQTVKPFVLVPSAHEATKSSIRLSGATPVCAVRIAMTTCPQSLWAPLSNKPTERFSHLEERHGSQYNQ